MSVDEKSSYYDAGGIETIDIMRAKLTDEQYEGYLLGNIIKYSSRCNFKGSKIRDIEKVAVYADLLKILNLEEVDGSQDPMCGEVHDVTEFVREKFGVCPDVVTCHDAGGVGMTDMSPAIHICGFTNCSNYDDTKVGHCHHLQCNAPYFGTTHCRDITIVDRPEPVEEPNVDWKSTPCEQTNCYHYSELSVDNCTHLKPKFDGIICKSHRQTHSINCGSNE